MRLTLGDLLDQAEFGLELCTGGETARQVSVDGAHSIDLPDPVRWLQESWVMLTTGVQLRGKAAAQRHLIAQLDEGRIAALGFGLGVAMRRVPSALEQEAEQRGFPVFTVPFEMPFREIISFVNRSALSADLYALRRLTSMQRYLLDAMHQPEPDQALVERLASLLGSADVCYLDATGSAVAATAATDTEWSAAALGHGVSGLREFEHDDRWGVVAPVFEGDAPAGWLAVLLTSAGVSRQVARPVVRAASELLGLASVSRLAAGRGRRDRRRRLGERALRAMRGERDDGLPTALAVEGLDFTVPCRVAVLAPAPRVGAGAGVRAAIEAALENADADLVTAFDGDELVVLAQDDLAHLADWLDPDPGIAAVRAGISQPLLRLESARAALDEARLSLTVALAGPGRPAAQRHEALEPSVALLGPGSPPHLHDRLTRALEPLDREPRLRAAVVAYLESGFDVGRAAHALGLHRNSLRYRLDRAEQLLGRSLRSPGTVATLHLALVAERLRGS
jgi:purine catabolism regulatory family protein/PucR-like helix-turn-helix protein/diguanylate cyclase with GGDEF domain